MTATAVRSRMFTAGGGLLAAAGLAATLAMGPAAFAETHLAGTTANATVSSTITLTATDTDTAFTLTGAPGDTAIGTSRLTAESNSGTGYNVSVLADQANLTPDNGELLETDPAYNSDTIPVTSLQVADSGGVLTALGGLPVTVHTQPTSSIQGGDLLVASYSLEMPFVDADTYSGGLTFTAAAN